MPYSLRLPDFLRNARWKVKIRDREIREPPHVTIIHGVDAWRVDLRHGTFMDGSPDPARVPRALVELVFEPANWGRLREAWDRMYPSNPVGDDLPEEA